MIIREKLIFWILLPVLAAIVAIGINVQEKKKQSSNEFLRDIESVTEKAKAKKKIAMDNLDLDGLKKQSAAEDYSFLIERGIFFRPVSEVKNEKKEDIVILKKEEPKKPMFVYKGRMNLGGRVIVIIEDDNTGKSFSVKEGDTTDDFTVLSIGEKEILLKKKDGEEIAVPTVRKENKEEKTRDPKEPEGSNEKI
jgi:hypothetical protein